MLFQKVSETIDVGDCRRGLVNYALIPFSFFFPEEPRWYRVAMAWAYLVPTTARTTVTLTLEKYDEEMYKIMGELKHSVCSYFACSTNHVQIGIQSKVLPRKLIRGDLSLCRFRFES